MFDLTSVFSKTTLQSLLPAGASGPPEALVPIIVEARPEDRRRTVRRSPKNGPEQGGLLGSGRRGGGLPPGQVDFLSNWPGRYAIRGYALNTPSTLQGMFALQYRASRVPPQHVHSRVRPYQCDQQASFPESI